MWKRFRNTHVLVNVRANGDSPVSLMMTQSGPESTKNTQSVVLCVGGLRSWPIDTCSNKDAGKRECKTPTPCERTGKQTENNLVEVYACASHVQQCSPTFARPLFICRLAVSVLSSVKLCRVSEMVQT